jgi:hypothetical protein
LLFKDERVLPDFEMITLRAVQSIANNKPGFKDWFEALDWMCEKIIRINYDVAIIGAGAYGLPLAAFIKKSGKKAVHIGGASQLLFGIKGARWDQWPYYQQLYNEHWIRPLEEDIPKSHMDVENGCYW